MVDFQALFMRDMAGGSYLRSLQITFIPELMSMNWLMAGMVPTAMALRMIIPGSSNPTSPAFWFVMSMALLVGGVLAYPINWWLVSHGLKHGMSTVRPAVASDFVPGLSAATPRQGAHEAEMKHIVTELYPPLWVMALGSFAALAVGIVVASLAS